MNTSSSGDSNGGSTASSGALPGGASEFDQLRAVVTTLLSDDGCPWDAQQTHESLVKYLIEECYELVDAIEDGVASDIQEELGDVLYQVLFHSEIAAQRAHDSFSIEDVVRGLRTKLVLRHPHVFGENRGASLEEVERDWELNKQAEKPERTSVLDGIPRSLPALLQADKTVGRVSRLGISIAPLAPAQSELIASFGGPESDDELALGRFLLSVVADSRERGLDPERALRMALRELGDTVSTLENGAAADA